MRLLYDGKTLREYQIALGDNPEGHKQFEGDERTPEGTYSLDYRNPNSEFHLSYHISYPNADDRRTAELAARDSGGNIMVHGIRNGFGWIGCLHRFTDWTDGCIAIKNQEMTEFWQVVPVGTSIEINP
ncbi:MAG: L,D-transpeptidase family protein [candidate division Zixibacteria bacterium]|nr:L,D-transpeptidase family protein [candidate division Zixibacteria bacterium]